MRLKFTCKNCKKTGFAACSKNLPFLHCSWYMDFKGLNHGCLYCRSCGAVYDTIGSLLAPIKMIFGRMPSKIVAFYEFSEIIKLTRMNNSDFSGLHSMNPYVLMAMQEDGRLAEDEEFDEEPSIDFLLECIKDRNLIIRREAIIALKRLKDSRAVAPLVEALKDKHWDVRRNAAIALGDVGDSRAIRPLIELLETEKWEHLVIKEATIALQKLKGEGGEA